MSLAAPYPGTFLYKQAMENGWLDTNNADLVDDSGIQIAPLHYPHLSHTEIFHSVEEFYKRFYFRAPKIAAIVSEMVRSPQMMKRRLREGVEFFQLPARAAGGRALKRLVVTADDFGLAPRSTKPSRSAHRSGILSAASLMVAAPAAADAVERARRLPGLRVGLHVVLVEGTPALPPERVPDLVDRTGHFRTDMAGLGLDIFARATARRQLAAEIDAQFEAFRATGLPLDHVNAHKHFHLHPTIARTIIAIGRDHGMRGDCASRSNRVAVLRQVEPEARRGASALVAPWARLLARTARRAGLQTPDAVFGLAWSGAMTAARARWPARAPAGGLERNLSAPGDARRFRRPRAGLPLHG